jgi:ribosome-associated toxin RatA of RatAB toxin-antitoxin module
MQVIDRISIRAPLDRVFAGAQDVELWPRILPHYRWVRVLERRSDGAIVEMAAWRPFGAVRYPTWWVSHMTVDRSAHEISYRHIRGITQGMDVVWSLVPSSAGVDVSVVHRWDGPAWPLVGGVLARLVIGPVFIHAIASRTLAGIKRYTEETA